MLTKFNSVIKLGLIDPRLLFLSIENRSSQKTFLGYSQLLSLAENIKMVSDRTHEMLQIAEFGVGRGGSAMLLAWMVNHFDGTLTLFDVFDRIPSPSESDGDEAEERYQFIVDDENEDYYGNLPNLLETLKKDIGTICPLDRVEFIQGKYEDTLQKIPNDRMFNFVHIDCDWYDSIGAVFTYLQSHLQSGAILQIDDYLYWPGAKKATDETEWLRGYSRKLVGNALILDTSIRLIT